MRLALASTARSVAPTPEFKTTTSRATLSSRSSSSDANATASAKISCCCCAVVYISEGRNNSLLDDLADLAATTAPGSAGLIREFRDPQYHRTGFTIGGISPVAVARVSIEVSRRALQAIDLRLHEASHPRIGVVDHVSVHPLVGVDAGGGNEEVARQAGLVIATALGEDEGVPVLLYGDLKNGRRLAEVREETEGGGGAGERESERRPMKGYMKVTHGWHIVSFSCQIWRL